MLHLSSLNYYACYYALLYLLHQQQQALSVTIIIDGATTNEWATRDEYQRLVDGGPPEAQQAGDGGPAALAGGSHGVGGTSAGAGGGSSGGGSGARASPSPSSPLSGEANGNEQSIDRILHSLGGKIDGEDDANSAATGPLQGSNLKADELGNALDQLDLIERERKIQRQRLDRLKSLERAAEEGVVEALAHRSSSAKAQPAASARAAKYAGARTISDLVAPTGDEFDGPELGKHLVERDSPKRYCGPALVDLLEIVCAGRYYAGDLKPQVVEPTIKTKRSVDYAEALAAELNERPSRRRLRTLQQHQRPQASSSSSAGGAADGDGAAPGPLGKQYISNNNENIITNKEYRINDGNNNHNQQYLSNIGNNPSVSRSRQSQAARFRRIRGATSQCCARPCEVDELKAYCQS